MATSPREELVITALVVFGKFDGGWVWAEQEPNSAVVMDSGEKSFSSLREAVDDFFADESVDLGVAVDASDAHYSKLIHVSETEVHIRKYRFGAPDPIQAVK